MQDSAAHYRDIASALGLKPVQGAHDVVSPVDGGVVEQIDWDSTKDISEKISASRTAFLQWRAVPAPKRGELVRQLGEVLRRYKRPLAELVTLDCGKPISEAEGEVQEMIDICDFAVGLSRQLHGLTIASERSEHRMMESWHPLGVVTIISAFNFPVAVWAWNAALALVCGNAIIWKPSEKTPLTAIAVQALLERLIADFDLAPKGLSTLVLGGRDAGQALVDDPHIAMISATGSTVMGRTVGQRGAARFARTLLELGGNNATIIAPTADRDLALNACAFGFMGTTGQRCTSLRRLFVHREGYDDFVARLESAARSIAIGDPRDPAHMLGPLIDEGAYTAMQAALAQAQAMGASVSGGERIEGPGKGIYVRPAIVRMTDQSGPMLKETFAPILHTMAYDHLDEAIALNNAASQGLSSSIFTNDMREAERFVAATGSDCGIANVNIGTSGAEIGGAFGGEKETGGGRESGSDSWKAYMRRQTSTINYGSDLPLAQGVQFTLA